MRCKQLAQRVGVAVDHQPGQAVGLAVHQALAVTGDAQAPAQRHRLRYRSLPSDFPRRLPPAVLRLWHWRQDCGIGAAMAFVRHGAAATYQTGWAGPAARRRGVHQAMLWQAALALRMSSADYHRQGAAQLKADRERAAAIELQLAKKFERWEELDYCLSRRLQRGGGS